MFFLLLILSLASLTAVFFGATKEMFLMAALMAFIAWAFFILCVRGIFAALCRGKGPGAVLALMFAPRPLNRPVVAFAEENRPEFGRLLLLGFPFAVWFLSVRFAVLVTGNIGVETCNVIYLWDLFTPWFQCGHQTVFLHIDMMLLVGSSALFWGMAAIRFYSFSDIAISIANMLLRSGFDVKSLDQPSADDNRGPVRRTIDNLILCLKLLFGVPSVLLFSFVLLSIVVRALGSFPVGAEITVTTLFLILLFFTIPVSMVHFLVVSAIGGIIHLLSPQNKKGGD